MADTALWTSALTGAAAIGGVVVTVLADGAKERRRMGHDVAVRQADRAASGAERRRTFELENLLAAYDGLWHLSREMVKIHLVDYKVAQSTEHGYGGTRLPDEVETDIAVTSQAVKAIRLILDDEVRRVAQEANAAISQVGTLGVMAKISQRGPVSAAEGEAAMGEATMAVEAAMTAMADRIRTLTLEQ